MKRKLVSKSAFFSLRFLTGFAFCATGVFLALAVFARPNRPVEQQNQSLAQQSIPTFRGMPLTSEIQTGVDRPVPAAVLPEIDLPALPEIPNDKRYERALGQQALSPRHQVRAVATAAQFDPLEWEPISK